MKKMFTLLVASICGTMVYAQTDAISVNDVTIAKGGKVNMEVVVNNAASNTAFQFDLKLPAGVSVKSASMNSGAVTGNADDTQSRKLRWVQYGEAANNVYRFLSYDNANGAIADGKVAIALEATASAAAGKIAGSDILVVNSAGTSTTQTNGDVASIQIAEGVPFTIGVNKVTTLVSDKDLDFTNSEAKAYIATGYDYDSKNILLTRVKDVPKNTPILLMGDPDDYIVPVGTTKTYYPENFLKGNATTAATIDNSGNVINMKLKSGQFIALSAETFEAGKCYLEVPAESKIISATGDALSFTMGASGTKSYTGKYDLDFESAAGLSAYVVTGYDKDNTVWLSRVMNVSAKTPLVLLGKADEAFEVPSTAQKTAYVNMLRGDADKAITISKTEGEWTNLILKSGQFVGLSVESAELKVGASYLPIPTSIIATSRGELANQYKMVEAEVITMKAVIGDEATGISRIASEVDNDVWYNLKGQRIDTPTRKGLYIKNGQKVVVK